MTHEEAVRLVTQASMEMIEELRELALRLGVESSYSATFVETILDSYKATPSEPFDGCD